jgi:hypothetical protein
MEKKYEEESPDPTFGNAVIHDFTNGDTLSHIRKTLF